MHTEGPCSRALWRMSLSLECMEEEISLQGESLYLQYVKRKRKEKEKSLRGDFYSRHWGKRQSLQAPHSWWSVIAAQFLLPFCLEEYEWFRANEGIMLFTSPGFIRDIHSLAHNLPFYFEGSRDVDRCVWWDYLLCLRCSLSSLRIWGAAPGAQPGQLSVTPRAVGNQSCAPDPDSPPGEDWCQWEPGQGRAHTWDSCSLGALKTQLVTGPTGHWAVMKCPLRLETSWTIWTNKPWNSPLSCPLLTELSLLLLGRRWMGWRSLKKSTFSLSLFQTWNSCSWIFWSLLSAVPMPGFLGWGRTWYFFSNLQSKPGSFVLWFAQRWAPAMETALERHGASSGVWCCI